MYTSCSSAGVENLAVTPVIIEAKEKEPTPYLKEHENALFHRFLEALIWWSRLAHIKFGQKLTYIHGNEYHGLFMVYFLVLLNQSQVTTVYITIISVVSRE